MKNIECRNNNNRGDTRDIEEFVNSLHLCISAVKFAGLEISSQLLFSFDSFKQGFEIAFAEAFGAFALDDLEK
jgi:hypothetical protein